VSSIFVPYLLLAAEKFNDFCSPLRMPNADSVAVCALPCCFRKT
jgi:hypothetical protein